MHDITFSKEIVRVISERLKDLPKGSKVTAAHVSLSPLGHVTPKSLSEAFAQLVSGTGLEGVSLDVRPLPVKMKCAGCNKAFTVMEPTFSCVMCGSSDICMDDNREFMVESLEVEEG